MTLSTCRAGLTRTWVLASLLLWCANDAIGSVPEDCERLGGALVEHSCFHSKYGPFVSVQTTSDADTAPNVDPVHTEYRLGLSGEQSVVTYSPLRTGAWSVFLSEDVPLGVFDPEGRELERALSSAGNTGCEALPFSHVYELTSRNRYQLRFGAAATRQVVIVIEYVDDFLTANGKDGDGDGYGREDEVITTSCVPPEGYAPNASDCDDENPYVNPGRVEACDGIDQNCNGIVDDMGLSCWKGEDACRATGSWTCGDGDARAVCDANVLSGSEELCNGIDDDCDGNIDDGEDLCPDPERPLCARQERAASCGCLLDVDCGPEDSGRLCDAAQQRCVSGCSNEPGRNGCPRGFECIAADEGSFCEPDTQDELAPLDSRAEGCGCKLAGSKHASHIPVFCVLVSLAVLRSRRARRWQELALALLASGVSGCGGVAESDPERGRDPDPAGSVPCQPVLEEKPVTHACSHTSNGPFEDVVASAEAGTTGDVSALHHTFVVDVLATESFLFYEAQRGGDHVLMTDQTVALQVVDTRARLVSGAAFGIEGCKSIVMGHVAALEKGQTYRIEIGSGGPRPFDLFIEHLGAFRDPWVHSCPR